MKQCFQGSVSKEEPQCIALGTRRYPHNRFFYYSTKTYVVGTHEKRHGEVLLKSTTHFSREKIKISTLLNWKRFLIWSYAQCIISWRIKKKYLSRQSSYQELLFNICNYSTSVCSIKLLYIELLNFVPSPVPTKP